MSATRKERIPERLRSLVCLDAFVLVQHGYYRKAAMWLDVLHAFGDRSEHVLFTRTVANFLAGDYPRALVCLDEIDEAYPMERFGRRETPKKHDVRRYMRLRIDRELKN